MPETMLIRDQILDTAKTIINGEREGTYGKAEDSFASIGALWSAYLKKVARNASGVYKEDNWIDICGYAALGGEIQEKESK